MSFAYRNAVIVVCWLRSSADNGKAVCHRMASVRRVQVHFVDAALRNSTWHMTRSFIVMKVRF